MRNSVVENVPFWILSGVAIIIGTIAFFVPPKAEIHPSVLRFISWVFAFAALWTVFVAMVRGIDARLSHGKTTLSIGDRKDSPTSQNNQVDQNNEEIDE